MVRKVSDKQMGTMLDDVEREKDNIFYCLHPAVSKVSEVDRSVIFRRDKSIKRHIFNPVQEEEKALYKKLAEDTPDPSKQWFKMRKYQVENTSMAPRPLSEHYNPLNRDLTW